MRPGGKYEVGGIVSKLRRSERKISRNENIFELEIKEKGRNGQ